MTEDEKHGGGHCRTKTDHVAGWTMQEWTFTKLYLHTELSLIYFSN